MITLKLPEQYTDQAITARIRGVEADLVNWGQVDHDELLCGERDFQEVVFERHARSLVHSLCKEGVINHQVLEMSG